MALDGLRGVAAVAVVLFHFLACFAPRIVPDYEDDVPWWVDTPAGLLFHGGFAVSIFFVLSGFVLAAASYRPRGPLWVDIATRWIRLAVPATASVLIAWALLHAMPLATFRLERVIHSHWHRFVYQGSIPSFIFAIRDTLYDVFVHGGSLFNNVLWTMKFELIGSLGIYLFARIVPARFRLAGAVTALLLLASLRSHPAYLGFAFGLLAEESTRRAHRITSAQAWLLLTAGVLLAFPAKGYALRWHLGSLPPLLTPGGERSIVAPLAAFFIVLAIVHSPQIARPFVARAGVFLGRLSFSLYLVHVPLLYTVVASVVVSQPDWGTGRLALLFMAFLAMSMAIAYAFARLVDEPTLAFNRRLRRGLARPASAGDVR